MENLTDKLTGFRRGWAKKDRRPLPDWAHDNLTLPASYSVQGRFDVNINRPLIEIFAAIQNPLIHKIRFRKPPRFGGSLIADIAIPWIVCNEPGPIMWNWQSDDDAKGHMKEKAWALWNTSKDFRALLPPSRHDKTNTEIYFGPFFMVCQGANINNLQSKGVRWLFNDEVWLPIWQELYGQAEARCGDFKRSGAYKITDVSQAGNSRDVEDRNWCEGHQAKWAYLAKDGNYYPLDFGGKREDGSRWGLVWAEDARRKDGTFNRARALETARYQCRFTGQEWTDSTKAQEEWNRLGKYLPQNKDAPPNVVSFAVNGLLNYTFADLVDLKIKAMELASYGDMSGIRDFKQKYETTPWEETHLTVEISTEKSGYKYADYANGEATPNEAARAMTIDRQHGIGKDVPHRWVEIRAFSAGGDSRQLWFGRLETKEACRDLQLRMKVKDRCVMQDARFEKHEVFRECSEYNWLAVWSSDQNSWTHYKPSPGQEPQKIKLPYSPIQRAEVDAGKICHYIHFNDNYHSDILHNLLSGRGTKWEMPDDVSEEYVKHLKAEHKVEKRPGVYKWEKIHSTSQNHGRDTSKFCVVFAVFMRILAMPKLKDTDENAA